MSVSYVEQHNHPDCRAAYLFDGKWTVSMTPPLDGPHLLVAMVRDSTGQWVHMVGSPRNVYVEPAGVACPKSSAADGAGLRCTASQTPASFTIWAVGSDGGAICHGGDEFCVMTQQLGTESSAASYADVSVRTVDGLTAASTVSWGLTVRIRVCTSNI